MLLAKDKQKIAQVGVGDSRGAKLQKRVTSVTKTAKYVVKINKIRNLFC